MVKFFGAMAGMSKRILTSPGGLLVALVCCVLQASAQELVPVQADLVRSIEAGRVKAGDAVLAKVIAKWQSPECTLREGAILKGRIVSQNVRSKTEKTSQIAMLFEGGQCGGRDIKPIPLTVAAVLAVDPSQDRNEYENQPLSEAVGLGLGRDPGPNGIGGSQSGTRSVTQAAAPAMASTDSIRIASGESPNTAIQ